MAKRNVVIIKDTKGNTCYVAYISCLEQNEINKAINECNKTSQEREKEKLDLLKRVDDLEKHCQELYNEIKVLKGEE